MGWIWDDPQWVRQGRTGPGPAAPKYKKRKDRRKVRRENGSGNTGGAMLWAAIGLLGLPFAAALGVAAYLLRGYGVL